MRRSTAGYQKVIILSHWGGYNPGDVASFEPRVVESLCSRVPPVAMRHADFVEVAPETAPIVEHHEQPLLPTLEPVPETEQSAAVQVEPVGLADSAREEASAGLQAPPPATTSSRRRR